MIVYNPGSAITERASASDCSLMYWIPPVLQYCWKPPFWGPLALPVTYHLFKQFRDGASIAGHDLYGHYIPFYLRGFFLPKVNLHCFEIHGSDGS